MPLKKKSDFDAESGTTMSSAEIKAYMDEREIRFCEEYLRDLNATQAAIRAGYKPGKNNSSAAVQASRLMRDVRIRAFRAALQREHIEDMDLSRDTVVKGLVEIYQRCMTAIPVLRWDSEIKEWVESGVWRFDAKGAARALEQLSKLLGFEAPVKIDPFAGTTLEDLLKSIGTEREY